MLKTFKIVALIFLSFSFSSCIELVEEIKINPDLSGTYHIYIKHNGLEFLFNAFSPNLNLEKLERVLKRFEKQKGISDLTSNINPSKGKFSVQFDFSDAKSLTQAFYTTLGAEKQFYNKSFLKVNNSRIKRPNLTPYLIKYAENNELLDGLPSEKMLDYINYRYRIISSKSIKKETPPNSSHIDKENEYSHLYPLKSLLINGQSTKSVIRLNK